MKKQIKTILSYKRQGFIKKSLLIILALALVIFLMIGIKAIDNRQGKDERISEEDSVIQIEDLILNRKLFYTLERALDFVEFIPQLPKDKDYGFRQMVLSEKDNIKKLEIMLMYDADKHDLRMLRLIASKDNIIPEDYMRLTKDKKIGGIKGKENTSGDLDKFYWERKGVYYILEHKLEDEELGKVLKSFSNLNKKKIKEIRAENSEEKTYIYRDKDFEKAIEILGFTPQLIEKLGAYEIRRAGVDINTWVEGSKPYYFANYEEVDKNMGMTIKTSEKFEEDNLEKIKTIEINGKQIDLYKENLEQDEYVYRYRWEDDGLFTQVNFTGNWGGSGFKNVDEEYREKVMKKIIEY